MISIRLNDLPLESCDLEMLKSALMILQTALQQRVAEELATVEQRRQELESMLPSHLPLVALNEAPPASLPKYRDPATGKTWSGRGKRPQWFESSRAEDYLIAA